MANNKKWIIGGSIGLLILLGASIGAGYGIGYANRPEEEYIKIYLGGEEYNSQKIDLGTDSLSDAEKAALLENQFYSAALFGGFDGAEGTSDAPTYIFKDDNQDWNRPYVLTNGTTSSELQAEFVNVKFLSDTEDTSVYSFLTGLLPTANNQLMLLQAINQLMNDANKPTVYLDFPEVTGLDVISNEEFADTKTAIIDFLKVDTNYIKDVQKDILIYSYLWQDAPQKAYDYIITRELVYSSPSIVYSMTLDGEEADNTISSDASNAYDYLSNESVTESIEASDWNDYLAIFRENGILVDDSINENYLLDESNMQGYDGIKFGTSAGTMVSSDWTSWENTWINEEAIEIGESLTSLGNYTHENVLSQANLYLSDTNYSDGEGAVIFDTTESTDDPTFGNREGERKVFAYTQLYPFMFREKVSDSPNGDPLGSEQFSLFANDDVSTGYYTPAEDVESAANYIFDLWFPGNSLAGEIYVSEALIGNNSKLVSNALNYWNGKGFYIELSGSYEDDLASYLPAEILYDEN